MATLPEKTGIPVTRTAASQAPLARLTAHTNAGAARCQTIEPITLVGSRRDSHLTIIHPEISKLHAAIVDAGGRLIVCDLCSRTGTFVNGERVSVRALRPGDALHLGGVEIEIEHLLDGSAARGAAALQTLVGPQVISLGDRVVELHEGAALIGRHGRCTIPVDHSDVSPVHALIFTMQGSLAIADLGSRSGTVVNGKRVQLAWLHDADEVLIGEERFVLSCAEDAPPAESADVKPGLRSNVRATTPSLQSATAIVARIRADLDQARDRIADANLSLQQREAELRALCELLQLRCARLRDVEALWTTPLNDAAQLWATGAAGEVTLPTTAADKPSPVERERALQASWRLFERQQALLEARLSELAGSTATEPSGLPAAAERGVARLDANVPLPRRSDA
jgi:pSer/pThr/pTyr-binding forkhead associated (FHA) protein